MSYSPLAIKRSHVLGDIYKQCDPVEKIPVYMNDASGELLGHVDESLGHYADAFVFHLSEDVCKKLSSGHYSYSFDYDVINNQPDNNRHIRLNYIMLTGRKIPSKKA
jgi:hypothetical protein